MNSRITNTIHFVAGVYYNQQVIMSNYNLKLYMTTNTIDNSANNIAFERIKYFVHQILDSTVFVNQKEEEQCRKITNAGMTVTTLPDQPVDQIIGMMLYCKLNAITEERIIINEVELSSDIGGNVVYCHDETESIGPFNGAGWWHSSDLSHYELSLGDNIVGIGCSDTWRDLELQWDEEETTTENTIVFADFGKDETK